MMVFNVRIVPTTEASSAKSLPRKMGMYESWIAQSILTPKKPNPSQSVLPTFNFIVAPPLSLKA
jgi:hypothetical protein